jgi:NADH-quinone oxidoreductase subunit L
MWVPLAILATLAAFGGFLNAHLFHLHPFDNFLEPVFEKVAGNVKLIEGHEGYVYPLLGLAIFAFVAGVSGAYYVYVKERGEPARRFTEAVPGLHRLAQNKFEVDEFYDESVIGTVDALGDVAVGVDKWVFDGIVARFTAFVVGACGGILRLFQNGRVQAYSLSMLLGLGLVGWFFLVPRAEARTRVDLDKGIYSVIAAPGLGYSYRWDANGDDQWDTNDFGKATEVNVTLEPDQRRTVRLEVKNAFGQTASTDVALERGKPDLSGAPTTKRLEAPNADLDAAQRAVDADIKQAADAAASAGADPSAVPEGEAQ